MNVLKLMPLLLLLLFGSGCNLLIPFTVGGIEGIVLDADENPVVAVIEVWREGDKTEVETQTEADGTFSLHGLRKGTYGIKAIGEGFSGLEPVTVVAMQTTPVTIIVAATSSE